MKNVDLAVECRELHGDIDGVRTETESGEHCEVTTIRVETRQAAEKIGKPIGIYVTIELKKEPQEEDELAEAAEIVSQRLS